MKKILKRIASLSLVFAFCFTSMAAVVSDNDGSAFITKAEFDSLKNDFQAQIDKYNTSIDSKIDGAIASYINGIRVSKMQKLDNLYLKYHITGMKKRANGLGWSSKTSYYINNSNKHYASKAVDYMKLYGYSVGGQSASEDNSATRVILNKDKTKIESIKKYNWKIQSVFIGIAGANYNQYNSSSMNWNDPNTNTKVTRNYGKASIQGIAYSRSNVTAADGTSVNNAGYNDALFVDTVEEVYSDSTIEEYIAPLVSGSDYCVNNDLNDKTAPTYNSSSSSALSYTKNNNYFSKYYSSDTYPNLNPSLSGNNNVNYLKSKTHTCSWAQIQKVSSKLPFVDFQAICDANEGVESGLVIAKAPESGLVSFDVMLTKSGRFIYWTGLTADSTWGGQKSTYTTAIPVTSANTKKHCKIFCEKDNYIWCMYLPSSTSDIGEIIFSDIVQTIE